MSDRGGRGQDAGRERSVSPEGALRSYDRRKHELAQIVREGLAAAREAKNDQLERALQEVSAKLAGDHFNLVVVGQFSRGKSTLMNAILGKSYLPSGIVPVTSVITAVSYGSRERVVLRQGNSILTLEIPIRELVNYVTEQANPGNRRGITIAEVQAPVEILRRGFFFCGHAGPWLGGEREHCHNAEFSSRGRCHRVYNKLRRATDTGGTHLFERMPRASPKSVCGREQDRLGRGSGAERNSRFRRSEGPRGAELSISACLRRIRAECA